ncbi:helix-turn-helix domain-containing protein [Paenibacillus sp. GCM10023252]|uniref:helix-turn-helix domain-containing protein n=1 Tax=Paenibacillus sp. GCM10023252 TaxID=3252649 RepID=UPI00360676B1
MRMMMEQVRIDRGSLGMSYRKYTEQPFEGYYHSHHVGELLYIHQGKGKVIVGGRTYDMKAGMLFYFQPFQLHRVHADISADAPYVRTIIHYVPSMVEKHLQAAPLLQQFYLHLWQDKLDVQGYDLGTTASYMEALCRYYSDRLQQASAAELEEVVGLFYTQLVEIVRPFDSGAGTSMDTGISRVQRYSEVIMQWVEKHYREEFHLDLLAESMHLSKFYVSRIFRLETGSSITDYMMAYRLKEACLLLHSTSLSIERIGAEVGMKDTSYFIQMFKKHIGVTPRQYRVRGDN